MSALQGQTVTQWPQGNAGRAFDHFAAIPKDAGVGGLPIDREGLVDLDVLAGFNAAAAQDALGRGRSG